MARMGLAGAAGRWWGLALGLTAFFLPGAQAQVVQVNDSMYGFIGTDVVLHCSFANPLPSVKITQVTWQKATNGTKQNVAIYNPAMGVSVLAPYRERVEFLRPSFTDGTIRLSHLELEDEGVYICEFATFPTGNRESQLNLTVMAKPTNWIEGTQAVLRAKKGQDDKVLVATCTSANGKPPSVVSWETRLKGEAEYQEIRNPNGTVTVISRYRLVPSREAHQQSLACIVNYHTDRFKDSLTLNVQYEPEVTIEGFDGNWYLQRMDVKLTCKADANPPATEYRWTTLNGSLPKGVEAQNRTLFFKGPINYSLAGTYICEATNPIGTRSGQVEVNITEFPYTPSPPEHGRRAGPVPTAIIGGVAGSVLLVLIVVGGIVVALRRRRHTFKGDYSTKKHVYGNGYGKAGVPQHHPPLAQNLQYPDDSDDEKKAGPLGGSSYEEEEEEEGGGGGERKVGVPHPKYDEDAKRPYFTVDEAEARQDGYGDRTLGYQYDPEQLDLAENMVSQNDGSFISKKEWCHLAQSASTGEEASEGRSASIITIIITTTITIVSNFITFINNFITISKKPLPQGGPGNVPRLLGGAVAVVLILGVALAVFFLYRRQQKGQLGTDGDGTDLTPSQKLEPPPGRQSYLAPEDIQILHLEAGRLRQEEEELQKLSLQPPYYDLGVSPSYHPLGSGLKDPDVHYAELDTSSLELVPGQWSVRPGPAEAVEYATILLSPP